MWLQDRLSSYDEAFARKLSVDHLLEGHEGCVNRVCWNQDGTFLASASDDRKVHPRSWEGEPAVTALDSTTMTSVLFHNPTHGSEAFLLCPGVPVALSRG